MSIDAWQDQAGYMWISTKEYSRKSETKSDDVQVPLKLSKRSEGPHSWHQISFHKQAHYLILGPPPLQPWIHIPSHKSNPVSHSGTPQCNYHFLQRISMSCDRVDKQYDKDKVRGVVVGRPKIKLPQLESKLNLIQRYKSCWKSFRNKKVLLIMTMILLGESMNHLS